MRKINLPKTPTIKGKTIVRYSINGDRKKFEIITEIKQVTEPIKPKQNFWHCVATLDDVDYKFEDSEYYVDAQAMANDIAKFELSKLHAIHGKKLRVKKK